MKKIVLGMSMTLAALGILVPPAMAAAPQQDAPALGAFLVSLGTPAPASAAGRPIEKSADLCFAAVDCGDGTSVSCSSSVSGSSCSSVDRVCPDTRGSVTCDGVKTKCPVCPTDCMSLLADCAAQCGRCPITSFNCHPYSCTCLLCPN